MRPFRIVFLPPGRNDFTSMPHRNKPMFIQAFIPKLAVETLDVGILLRLTRFNEVQLQSVCIGPGIEHLAGELGAVVDGNDCGNPRSSDNRDSTDTTRVPGSDVSTSIARHSLVKSSTMFRQRKWRPSANPSDIKSIDQLWLGIVAGTFSCRSTPAIRFLLRRLTLRPACRYTRSSFFRLTCHPSRCINTCRRR